MPTAAVIEITGSHEECLYSQVLYCRHGGYRTLLVCSENLEEKVEEFGGDEQAFFALTGNEEKPAEKKELKRLRDYLLKEEVEVLIINTAHNGMIRRFLKMMSGKGIRMYGVLHGINKLRGSFTQQRIGRRLNGYFLLNDYLLQNLTPKQQRAYRFETLYPIHFPDFNAMPVFQKKPGQIRIVIPGQVELKRRDYITLLRTWAAMRDRPDICFILLGSWNHAHADGPRLMEEMDRLGIRDDFEFTGYMGNAYYHAYIKSADAVMPLIHPGKENWETYFRDQITGAFNMAFAYHKPLLMAEEFRQYDDFRENALFYREETLPSLLTGLATDLANMTPRIYQSEKWNFEYQAKKYLAFIGAEP